MSEIHVRKSVWFTNCLTLIFALSALFLVGLACGGSGSSEDDSSKSQVPKEYIGVWTGEDDTKLRIRGDGSGDYISSGYNIENGNVEYDEKNKTLEFSLFIMSRELKIDKPPEDGKMTLNGTVFKNQNYSGENESADDTDSSASDNKDSDTAKLSDEEVQNLIRETFNDFGKNLEKDEFTDFYENRVSEAWKKETSLKEFTKIYQPALDANMYLEIDKEINADFKEEPDFTNFRGKPAIKAEGSFPTKPNSLHFDVGYIKEGGEWLLYKFGFEMK